MDNFGKVLTNKLFEKVKLDLGFDIPLDKICLTCLQTDLDDPGPDYIIIKQDNCTIIKNVAWIIMFPDITGMTGHKFSLFYTFSISFDFLFFGDLAENPYLIFEQTINENKWRLIDLKLAYGKDRLTSRAKYLEISQFNIYNKLPYTKGFTFYRVEFISNQSVEFWKESFTVADYRKYKEVKLYLVYEKVENTSLIFNDLTKLVQYYKNSYKEYLVLFGKVKSDMEIDKTKYFTSDVEIAQDKVLDDLAIFDFKFLSESPAYSFLINKFISHFVLKDVKLRRYVILPPHIQFTEDEIRAGLQNQN